LGGNFGLFCLDSPGFHFHHTEGQMDSRYSLNALSFKGSVINSGGLSCLLKGLICSFGPHRPGGLKPGFTAGSVLADG
jgi:hypothetical protein